TEDVPTWDYQSVHAYGTGKSLNSQLADAIKDQQ
ncbi:MAG: FMN-binding negative transcriptional regulator, partial [Staphylococcus xylosus]|nr:FMN-binding negative transcriptional regulator [Staphylococcus xylosus]